MPLASPPPARESNDERFARFRALQAEVVADLAARPAAVRAWLESLPAREAKHASSRPRPGRGRAARLCLARRRELGRLLAAAEAPEGREALAAWLLGSLPVGVYFQIAAGAGCGEASEASRRLGELAAAREELFAANYGLARASVGWHRDDRSDELSAASLGLLDAIDRYVPGPEAARFGYFAGYWIRHRLGRHLQKFGSTVAFPIHQQRLERRIERYVALRLASSGSPPRGSEICEECGVGPEALARNHQPPRMVYLQGWGAPDAADPDGSSEEYPLLDPTPPPAQALEEAEDASELGVLFRACTDGRTRVMLAYLRGIGCLAEACEDHLEELARAAAAALAGR